MHALILHSTFDGDIKILCAHLWDHPLLCKAFISVGGQAATLLRVAGHVYLKLFPRQLLK